MSERWEWRLVPEPLELRASPTGGRMAVGYAFRYGAESQNLGGFVETIMPGAATRTIQQDDLRALFNHDPSRLLGRMGAGTLRVTDDNVGLAYQIDLPETSIGRDLSALIARGDIDGSSFTFIPTGARSVSWARTQRGFPLRQIRSMKMRDLGPVTFPAYPDAEVALRSLALSSIAEQRDLALSSLAEQRGLPLEEVIAAAADERLGELLGDDDPERPPQPVLSGTRRYW